MKNLSRENLHMGHKLLKNNILNATLLEILSLTCLVKTDNLEESHEYYIIEKNTTYQSRKCFSITTH